MKSKSVTRIKVTRLAQFAFVAFVLIAGIFYLQRSGAATSTVAAEAESGAVAGNASVDRTIVGSSAGGAVKFGVAGNPSPNPTPPPNPADRVFTETFEAGTLSQWSNQSCPSGATVVTERARLGTKSVKLTVSDGDTRSKCGSVPTQDPRAQLVSKGLFRDGDEYYIGFSTFFPSNFPTPRGFFQISEFYGPPFGGSPSMGVDMCGLRVCFQRDQSHGYDRIWTMTRDVARGTAWEDFVFRVKFSTNANVGFVEVWHNGVKQTMSNGQQRVTYQTLRPGLNWNGTPNSLFMNQYRQAGQGLGTVTIYHDEAYVGRTYESVAR